MRAVLARSLALGRRVADLASGASVHLALAFIVSDRSDAALESLVAEEMPPGWRDLPFATDAFGAYQRVLSAERHEVCGKGSGKTSQVEGLNTLWRQRLSGFVRRSCGVSWRIIDDLRERMLILMDWHDRRCLKRIASSQQQADASTAGGP